MFLEEISKELGIKVETAFVPKSMVESACKETSQHQSIKEFCKDLHNVFKPHMKELGIPSSAFKICLTVVRETNKLSVLTYIHKTDTLAPDPKASTLSQKEHLMTAAYSLCTDSANIHLEQMFLLNDKLKGRGIASDYLKFIVKNHYDSGVRNILMTTADRNGPFVWGKYGFRPNKEFEAIIKDAYKTATGKKLNERNIRNSFSKIMETIPEDKKATHFHEFSDIEGSIDLNHPASRRRLESRFGEKISDIVAKARIKNASEKQQSKNKGCLGFAIKTPKKIINQIVFPHKGKQR